MLAATGPALLVAISASSSPAHSIQILQRRRMQSDLLMTTQDDDWSCIGRGVPICVAAGWGGGGSGKIVSASLALPTRVASIPVLSNPLLRYSIEIPMAAPGPSKVYQYKLVLLGDSAVGKSSLVLRFAKGQFFEFQESTIGGALALSLSPRSFTAPPNASCFDSMIMLGITSRNILSTR